MYMIHTILEELNLENGSNYKISVLKKYSDNELLQRVLKMAYDRVAYTYGITMKNVDYKFQSSMLDLEDALDMLTDKFCTREVTGNAALNLMGELLSTLEEKDAELIKKILNRDLRINIGKTQINKVFKDLITKPSYMRCDVYSKKTAKNITFPAIVQLKADGTYREFTVENGSVNARSRSGEEYEYPVIFEQMKGYPDGVYTGELTVMGISDRAKGNGLINSDEPPHESIVLELWDYITPEEYAQAAKKDRKNPCKTPYFERFAKLDFIVKESINVKLIPTRYVDSISDALKQCSEWMSNGYEGAILKDKDGVFKDGTSKQQLKLKLQIDAEVRITGFTAGTVGTKREGKIGAIEFANDEGTIKGRTSGFTDSQLDEFTANQEELIGKVMTVQFNDVSKAENNDYYALSHPRFIEIRDDKDETDTLEKVFKLREMAMELS